MIMRKLKRAVAIKAPSAKELIEEMERFLPILMYPLSVSIPELRGQGVDVSLGQELLVTNVMDSGDTGGVMCGIEFTKDKSVLLTSITRLKIPPDHPLSSKIVAYQRHRIKKLARQRAEKK